MTYCYYCGQSFTRDEHLERHILTHTNIKPFKCFTCHMSFARRDLLQRHYTVHGRDANNEEGLPPNPGIIPKSAGRTPIACSNCAKTKTKCDKKFPCSRCEQRNLKCTLRPTRRASKNTNRLLSSGQTAASAPSASGNNDSQNISSATSPARDGQASVQSQPQAVNPQVPSSQLSSNGQPSQSSQPPTVAHSRNPSISPRVQQLQNLPAEEKPFNMPIAAAFEQTLSNGLPSTMPAITSPLPAHVSEFVSHTPISGYEDFASTAQDRSGGFAKTVQEHSDHASPGFIMDHWNPISLPQDFGPIRVDPGFMMPMSMDLSMGVPADRIFGMIPDMSPPQPFGPVHTPIQTPALDDSFSDMQIGTSASTFHPPNTQDSRVDADAGDSAAVLAAQDSWNVFRCTPTVPSSSCPRTAKLYLERLEQSSKNHEGWSSWRPSRDEPDSLQMGGVDVSNVYEPTRDKLLAITQSFLHKALDIHKDGMISSSSDSPGSTASNFVLLPPAPVLDLLLRSYANSFERFYPTSPRGTLDSNELMQNYNDIASSLLILMMIVQGAMAIPSSEARWLTAGLTEACRISLFNLVEKNILMASDPVVLRAALLFTVQAAWSGDKWQMDIAMGQRGMYFAMLRHSGILEPQRVSMPLMDGVTTDALWQDWIQQESRSRLIYSWVMVDQDLSLFHDTAPLFSVTEFGAPMPDVDGLWRARNASEWSDMFSQVHTFSAGYSSVGSGARPLSLRDLFRHFLEDGIITHGIQLTALHLRLLLHPLQTLVCKECQLLSCFSDSVASRQRSRAMTAASTRVRLEEVQSLLQRWFELAERYMAQNLMCPMMQASLVMFHLICMNAVTDFPEIERLARREGVDGSYQQMLWIHKKCISEVHEAIFHSGQIMRIIRDMPKSIRPPWWPGAIYRASLVLWANALTHTESKAPHQQGPYTPPPPSVSIDRLLPDDPAIVRYVTGAGGIPTLTKRDGTALGIDNGFNVLSHSVDVIGEGIATQFSDGIRDKLEKLARG